MSFGSFFAGLAGLQANNQRLSVIGNNLANLNTLSFKSSRVTFHDIFSGFATFNGAGNPTQVGRGVQIAGVDPIFSQGSLSSTSLLTDIAIQGNGYFVMNDPSGGQTFSRAGNFSFDSNGNLISNSGFFVQGFTEQPVVGRVDGGHQVQQRSERRTDGSRAVAGIERGTALKLDDDVADARSIARPGARDGGERRAGRVAAPIVARRVGGASPGTLDFELDRVAAGRVPADHGGSLVRG